MTRLRALGEDTAAAGYREAIWANQRIADAARAYIAALDANAEAESSDWVSARVELDRCLHELRLVTGVGCVCDPKCEAK